MTNLYQYDSFNRLTNLVWKLNNNPLASFAYQLKASGTRTNLIESMGTQPQTTYGWSYDNLYRLTNENINPIGNLGYRYDPVGNRTNRNSTISQLSSASYAYGTNDWLSTDKYDADGTRPIQETIIISTTN